jgi:hypothetical protein
LLKEERNIFEIEIEIDIVIGFVIDSVIDIPSIRINRVLSGSS